MMPLSEMEKNVLCQVGIEMHGARSVDTINTLYRQARVWARFNCYYADVGSPQRVKEFNIKLKTLRDKNVSRVLGLLKEENWYDK